MSNNFSYLTGSLPFYGTYENVQNYNSVLINYYTASTDELTISYSNDIISTCFTVPNVISGQQQIIINPIYKFFKVSITGEDPDPLIVRYCTCRFFTELVVQLNSNETLNISDAETHTLITETNETLNKTLNVSDTVAHADLITINYSITDINSALTTTNINTSNINDSIAITNTNTLNTVAALDTINTNTADTNTALATTNSTLSAINTKLTAPTAIIQGINSSNTAVNINASDQNNLCVEINGSNSAFGDIIMSSMDQILHNNFIYGATINSEQNTAIMQNNGAVIIANNLLTCATTATANSNAYVRSRQIIKYSPGIGVTARFTAIFNSINANSMLIGLGTPECGIYFGTIANSNTFSAIVTTAAYRQIVKMTITNGTNNTGDPIILTLNGVAYTITMPDIAVSTTITAYTIASANYNSLYPGWTASASGSVVTFVSNTSGAKTGTYSVSGNAVTATYAYINGANGITTAIAQADWNVDKLDGNGPSKMTLDTSKGNIYWIKFQYLGFGQITFGVENPATGKLIPVHQIRYANANTSISLSNPAMPFVMSNFGSLSNTISCGSYAAFIEGNSGIPEIVRNYVVLSSTITTTKTPIFSLRNILVYSSRVNQSTVFPLSINIANASARTVIIYLNEDCTLNTLANFAQVSPNSIVEVDTSATGFATSTSLGIERLAICLVGNSNQTINLINYNVIVEPGSILTISGKTNAYTANDVNIAIQWVENQ